MDLRPGFTAAVMAANTPRRRDGAPGPPAGLARPRPADRMGAQPRRQPLGLGRLAGALAAFQGDEPSAHLLLTMIRQPSRRACGAHLRMTGLEPVISSWRGKEKGRSRTRWRRRRHGP